MTAVYCARCGSNPCACDDDAHVDEDGCDCATCRADAQHVCVFVGADDHDECDVCGRRLDPLAGRPDHEQVDWDGAA